MFRTALEISSNISSTVFTFSGDETCPSTTSKSRCSRLCMAPEGSCQDNGKCLCKAGFTGPNAAYVTGSSTEVEASHCLNTCGVKNSHQDCVPANGCDSRCVLNLGGQECITSGTLVDCFSPLSPLLLFN